jgi:hypothetical protein
MCYCYAFLWRPKSFDGPDADLPQEAGGRLGGLAALKK